jgi:hypothetical protein
MSKQPTDRKQKQREKRQEEEQQREQVEQQLMKERLKEQMDSNFCDTMGVIVKVSYGISALLVVWIVINMFFLKRNWPPAEQFPVYEYRNLIEKGDRLTLEVYLANSLYAAKRMLVKESSLRYDYGKGLDQRKSYQLQIPVVELLEFDQLVFDVYTDEYQIRTVLQDYESPTRNKNLTSYERINSVISSRS